MSYSDVLKAFERVDEARRAFERVGQSPFDGIQKQIDDRLAAFDQVEKASALLREAVGLAAATMSAPQVSKKATRHWVRAYIESGHNYVWFELVCEHPDDCQETAESVRNQGCAVKDWFDDANTDLLDGWGETEFGRVEVGCRWMGRDEDGELDLVPPSAVSS